LALAGCSSGRVGAESARTPAPSATAPLPSADTSATPATTRLRAPANSTAASPKAGGSVPSARSISSDAPVKGTDKDTDKDTAPGTYTLDTSGSVSYGTPPQHKDASGTHTLVVSALAADSQTFTRKNDGGGSQLTFHVRASGTYLADLQLTSPAFTKEYRPAAAVLYVPDPANVGTNWSYSGKTTDGKSTITSSNKVTGATSLTIGGKKVLCAVLTSHLVLSGDIDYTADVTTWWSPEYRLPVKDRSIGKGRYGGVPFSSDTTNVMRSVTPS
jgi:hypothetical protein